ncbi:MAG: acetate/propionate family kinase [Proteobacteria bacterium]|nr:acetate/propionate family kinase [Pseudomonadota bacterium]
MADARSALLALNVGSSSLKFAAFEAGPGLGLLCRGAVTTSGVEAGQVRVLDHERRTLAEERWCETERAGEAVFHRLLERLGAWLGGRSLAGVGHRIVHGGDRRDAVRLDSAEITRLENLCPLAPLHQPQGLEGVRAVAAARSDLPQTASFDTAFHADHRPPVNRFALPRRFEAEGVRRYGFHGLSYAYVAGRLAELDSGFAAGRVIVAHLGSGASLCALSAGRSVDTTMGFSALDGLVMATRSGALDPGVVLYLQDRYGLDTTAVSDLLYRRSGLLGVSGLTGDMRALLDSPEPAAREAVELFVFRVAREVGALAMTLGGLDGVVFTGGVGEHAAPVRSMICERLQWLGARIDEPANTSRREGSIAAAGSRLGLWVVPTDEERVVAGDLARLLR